METEGCGILDANGKVVLEPDLIKWAQWKEANDAACRVADTQFTHPDSGATIRVSTVFLGLDHGMHYDKNPLWFETMVFGGTLNERQWRYETWAQASEGHKSAVSEVKKAEVVPLLPVVSDS